LEEGFLKRLDTAFSNETPPRSGRAIFLEEAKPSVPAHLRVAAGAALWEAVKKEGRGGRPGPGVPGMSGVPGVPGVPGFQVTKVTPELFRVTHKRTGREWEVEANIRRPSSGQGAVAARTIGEGTDFIPLDLKDMPEDFQVPITKVLIDEVPEFSQALIFAVEELEGDRGMEAGPPPKRVERVRDLADLHILLDVPIPFDAQTTFFRILRDAPPEAARLLTLLRGPLGFTPNP
jgi:hypothetical protein